VVAVAAIAIIILSPTIFRYKFRTTYPSNYYDQNNALIIGIKQEPFTDINKVTTRLTDIIVTIEDKRFRKHQGIDFIALARAIRKNKERLLRGQGSIQ